MNRTAAWVQICRNSHFYVVFPKQLYWRTSIMQIHLCAWKTDSNNIIFCHVFDVLCINSFQVVGAYAIQLAN